MLFGRINSFKQLRTVMWVVMIIPVLLAVGLTAAGLRSSLERAMTYRTDQVMSELNLAVEYYYYTQSDRDVERVAKRVIGRANIPLLEVEVMDELVYSHKAETPSTKTASGIVAWAWLGTQDTLKHVEFPILVEPQVVNGDSGGAAVPIQVGIIRMNIDFAEEIAEATEQAILAAALAILTCFVGFVFTQLFYRRLLGTAAKFRSSINVFESDVAPTKITGQVLEELTAVATAYNSMTDSVAAGKVELETRVADRTRELQEALIKAEAADMAKVVLLRNVSHELRTPLATIQASLESLAREKPTETGMAIILRANKAYQALSDRIKTLLYFTKLQSAPEGISARYEAKGVADFVEEVIDADSHIAKKKGLYLDFIPGDDVPDVAMIATEDMRFVLQNLVGNALKFTDAGGVVVRTKRVGINEDGVDVVEFSVSDTGPGIQEDKLSSIFDAFSQVDNSDTKTKEGWGVGLSVYLGAVLAMGGTHGVTSVVGEGSTFWFQIPLKRAKHPKSSIERAGRWYENSLKKPDIWVLDDRESFVESIVTRFALAGIPVSPATKVADVGATADILIVRDASRSRANEDQLVALKRDSRLGMIVDLEDEADSSAHLEMIRRRTGFLVYDSCLMTEHLLHSLPKEILRNTSNGGSGDAISDLMVRSETPLTGISILLVDDAELIRESHSHELAQLGATVQCAASGEAAIAYAKGSKFDVIVMDIQMPHMDGPTTARHIRDGDLNRDTPIIALTADALARAEQKYNMIFDTVLIKADESIELLSAKIGHYWALASCRRNKSKGPTLVK